MRSGRTLVAGRWRGDGRRRGMLPGGVAGGAGGPALVPDPARARAMMPAIIGYLESPAYRQDEGGFSGYSATV
jgi:hypothetical protein